MNHRIFDNRYWLAVTLLLLGLGVQFANAGNAAITGSYDVIERTNLGSQTKIMMRLKLTNHEQGALYVQKILLWDSGYPPIGTPRSSSIALHSGASEVTTEFVIRRAQADQWRKGLLPRIVLELQTAKGTKMTEVIRLGRVPARKGE